MNQAASAHGSDARSRPVGRRRSAERRMPEPGLILVLAPNWLGDAVMALPAIDDVRRSFADARLVVAARASVRTLFAMVPWRRRRSSSSNGVGRLVNSAPCGATWRDCAAWAPMSRCCCPTRSRRRGSRAAREFPNGGVTRPIRADRCSREPWRSRVASLHQGAYYQHLVRELGIPNGPLEPRVDGAAGGRAGARAADGRRMGRRAPAGRVCAGRGVRDGQTLAAEPLRNVGHHARSPSGARTARSLAAARDALDDDVRLATCFPRRCARA